MKFYSTNNRHTQSAPEVLDEGKEHIVQAKNIIFRFLETMGSCTISQNQSNDAGSRFHFTHLKHWHFLRLFIMTSTNNIIMNIHWQRGLCLNLSQTCQSFEHCLTHSVIPSLVGQQSIMIISKLDIRWLQHTNFYSIISKPSSFQSFSISIEY